MALYSLLEAHAEGERIARELIEICASHHLEDLREEMVTRLIMKEIYGKHIHPIPQVAVATSTIRYLCVALAAFTDDIAGITD